MPALIYFFGKGFYALINVAIVTTSDNVAYAMSTVVSKRGAKSRHIKEYSFAAVKSCNIVIFDLDHIDGYEDQIKKDSGGFTDLIAIGYGRDQDMMDDFRPIMSVREKPLLTEHFVQYLQDLRALRKTDRVVNTDPDPICNSVGIGVEELLDMEILSDRDRMLRLKKVVDTIYKGPGEEEFLDSIGIGDIKRIDRTVEIVVEKKKTATDYRLHFIDDALIMYRAKRLKQMRLSVQEIDMRIKELMKNDIKHAQAKSSLFTTEEVLDEFSKSKRYSDIQEEIQKRDPDQTNTLPTVKSAKQSDQSVFQEFEVSEDDIEKQRKEAIGSVDQPGVHDLGSTEKNNNYTEAELKYVRDANSSTNKTRISSAVSSSARSVTGEMLSNAELSDRLHKNLTPEQIEKLRKLGVKI